MRPNANRLLGASEILQQKHLLFAVLSRRVPGREEDVGEVE